MPFSIKRNKAQSEAADAKLTKIQMASSFVRPMQVAVDYALSKVPPYPSKPAEGLWARLTTTKQKRAFFARYPNGYKRTGQIGRSITGQVKNLGSEVSGIIGTNTAYAMHVIDKKRQVEFHKKRWWTLQDVIEDNKRNIGQIFINELSKEIEGN